VSETSNQHSGQDHTGQKTVRVRASELIGRSWLNTGEKNLDLQALRGKIVILDFWTLCCINCLHVLDELRPLEEEFSDVLVTVGVHSPKFEHEADPVALAAAVDRYDIKHPVLDDPELTTWQAYTARALPPGHDTAPLAAILTAHRLPDTSHIPLQLSYSNGKASGRFQVPPKWMVTPSSTLFDELEKLLGSRAVRVNWEGAGVV